MLLLYTVLYLPGATTFEALGASGKVAGATLGTAPITCHTQLNLQLTINYVSQLDHTNVSGKMVTVTCCKCRQSHIIKYIKHVYNGKNV